MPHIQGDMRHDDRPELEAFLGDREALQVRGGRAVGRPGIAHHGDVQPAGDRDGAGVAGYIAAGVAVQLFVQRFELQVQGTRLFEDSAVVDCRVVGRDDATDQ